MANRAPIAPLLLEDPVAGSLLQSISGAVPGDWRTGVCFETRPWVQLTWPDCVPDWEDCNSATLLDKPVGSGDVYPDCDDVCFDPFTVYTPVSEISVQPNLAQRLSSEVDDVHDALLSGTIAKVFAGLGTINGGGSLLPFCVDSGLNPTLLGVDQVVPGGPRAPTTAFAVLLQAYAAEMGTTGGATFHVAPVVLPFLVAHGVVAQQGLRYVSVGGATVVADAGYAGLSASPYTTSTMFVTGPVEVSLGRKIAVPGSQFDDARLNQWAYLVEQRAIYRFEPRSVFSIAVSTPLPGTGEV